MSREICNCLFITSGHNVQKWKGRKNEWKKWKEVIYKTYDNEVRFCYARTLTSLETGEETTFTYTCKDSLKGYVYHLDYEIDSEHLKYEDIIERIDSRELKRGNIVYLKLNSFMENIIIEVIV